MIKHLLLLGSVLHMFAASSVAALSFWDLEPARVREIINKKVFDIPAETPAVHHVTNLKIEHDGRTTALRIYTPNNCKNLPIVLFIHGGAWVGGNLDTHDNMARYISKEAAALVVSVDYLSSPEGKFPLPLEQCYDALLWIVEHAGEFHADAHRLAVMGDSAGGNMAAALCLLARDRQGPTINLQVLVNPATDLTGNGTIQPQGDVVDLIRWTAKQYVNDPNDVNSPYVSPIVATNLANLPPALVILAEHDPLRNDGQRYAERLIAANVPTNIYIQWGIGHLAGHGARAATQAQESLDVAAAVLRGVFFKNHSRCESSSAQ